VLRIIGELGVASWPRLFTSRPGTEGSVVAPLKFKDTEIPSRAWLPSGFYRTTPRDGSPVSPPACAPTRSRIFFSFPTQRPPPVVHSLTVLAVIGGHIASASPAPRDKISVAGAPDVRRVIPLPVFWSDTPVPTTLVVVPSPPPDEMPPSIAEWRWLSRSEVEACRNAQRASADVALPPQVQRRSRCRRVTVPAVAPLVRFTVSVVSVQRSNCPIACPSSPLFWPNGIRW